MSSQMKYGISPFTLNVILVILVICGLAVLPFLNVKLHPEATLPSITVSCQWPGATARTMESEITTRLEAVISTLRSVKSIQSKSSTGQAIITVEFTPSTDMEFARFEVANQMHDQFTNFPPGVTYPVISLNRADDEVKTHVLSYGLNASVDAAQISAYFERNLRIPLSLIEGVQDVRIYGTNPYYWKIICDFDKMHVLGITASEVKSAIRLYMQEQTVGETKTSGNESVFLQLSPAGNNKQVTGDIPVAERGGRIIRLGEIAGIQYLEKEAGSCFRINGKNTVNINLYAEKHANHLLVASRIKRSIENLSQDLPAGFCLINSYDSSKFLKAELLKIAYRTLLSLVFLLVLLFIVLRRLRYLLVVTISLLTNLVVACIFYYLTDLEIHLYTLAGITVSFGIIIDNTLIMADHIRVYRNRKAFLAILAATLTTIGALAAVFFLEESVRLNLVDFARVVMINLLVSLVIALVFLPAVMDKIHLAKPSESLNIRKIRRKVRLSQLYRRILTGGFRVKWFLLVLVILAFGLPVNKLPDLSENMNLPGRIYNLTLGSEFFSRQVKPVLYKVTGGALRLFNLHVFERYFYVSPGRTALYLKAYLPEGASMSQMNGLMEELEKYLLQYLELEQFQVYINSPRHATLIIYFRKASEKGAFPYRLKAELEQYAVQCGGADFSVYGVGQGFSNLFYSGFTNSAVVLTGYNYDQMLSYAGQIRDKLLEQPRIQEVFFRSEDTWMSNDPVRLQYLVFNPGYEQQFPFTPQSVNENLAEFNHTPGAFMHFTDGGMFTSVVLTSWQAQDFVQWDFFHRPLYLNSDRPVKLDQMAKIHHEKGDDLVVRKNQQYILTLTYDYIGSDKMARIMEDSAVVRANKILPMGYKAAHRDFYYWWQNQKTSYWLIALIFIVIYFICAILLESLTQPLVVVLLIPVSFIGVFLTFYLFRFSFDQGGFASFLLLSGLTVNSTLYLLNQLNILEKEYPGRRRLDLFLKSVEVKITPVLLTVLSTVAGLVPFVAGGQDEVFWFALAAGVIGGLVFSIPAVLFLMPVMLKKNQPNNVLRPVIKLHSDNHG